MSDECITTLFQTGENVAITSTLFDILNHCRLGKYLKSVSDEDPQNTAAIEEGFVCIRSNNNNNNLIIVITNYLLQ